MDGELRNDHQEEAPRKGHSEIAMFIYAACEGTMALKSGDAKSWGEISADAYAATSLQVYMNAARV